MFANSFNYFVNPKNKKPIIFPLVHGAWTSKEVFHLSQPFTIQVHNNYHTHIVDVFFYVTSNME